MGQPAAKQSILVVGSGALGQFYAAQFLQAGHELRLLARRDASVLRSRGLWLEQTPTSKVQSSLSHPVLSFQPEQFRVGEKPSDFADLEPPDWILFALKSTGLSVAEELLVPHRGAKTRLIVTCNGLGIEDALARFWEPERLFGMLCYAAINRLDDGRIRHVGFGHVGVGHYLDQPEEAALLGELCTQAGIETELTPSLLEARWRKLAWNLPFNGLCLLHDCDTKTLVTAPHKLERAEHLVREVVALANLDLARSGSLRRIEPEWAKQQVQLSLDMAPYLPSTLVDRRAARPIEWQAIFAEAEARALQLGGDFPHLHELWAELRASQILGIR